MKDSAESRMQYTTRCAMHAFMHHCVSLDRNPYGSIAFPTALTTETSEDEQLRLPRDIVRHDHEVQHHDNTECSNEVGKQRSINRRPTWSNREKEVEARLTEMRWKGRT